MDFKATSRTSITNADEAALLHYVESARERLVYIAPGVSEPLAEAIARSWQRLGGHAVTVILDVDPEVCRLGLGTLEGIKRLREVADKLGTHVSHQVGVRIGLAISDHRTLIFSPTPLLIEAETTSPKRLNAIELATVPEVLAAEVGLGPSADKRIGCEALQSHRLREVEADLRAAPPVRFDLARRVRVFTSRFQFVELEMNGCLISRRRVRIPSALVGLAQKRNVESRFHAHFDLIQKQSIEVKAADNRVITERSLQHLRRAIERRFLVQLPGYGMVVLRANKDKLQQAVEELEHDVAAFSKGVKSELEDRIKESQESIVVALLPALKRNPPDEYTKTHGPNVPEDFLLSRLTSDIARAFGTTDALVSEMKVRLMFKDVAYESLIDEQFLTTARKAMPEVEFLHDEFQAAPARAKSST